ncbi:hypothetical protein BJ944DRAFT_227863 [Cunninghamella echinulata]|nr:hypothetical protein BJ944DRAFT_227863 [Cunninghamella echinulata]
MTMRNNNGLVFLLPFDYTHVLIFIGFITKKYTPFKSSNPQLSILIREADKTKNPVFIRFSGDNERKIVLQNASFQGIKKKKKKKNSKQLKLLEKNDTCFYFLVHRPNF